MTAQVISIDTLREHRAARRQVESALISRDHAALIVSEPCGQCGGEVRGVAFWSPDRGLVCEQCGRSAKAT